MTLLVSKGSNLVEVPSVLDLEQDDAEAEIEAAGLHRERRDRDLRRARGNRDRAGPGSGGAVKVGSEVTITVSTGRGGGGGPERDRGNQQGGRATLRAQGLKVSVSKQNVTDTDDDGVIIDQVAERWHEVPRGTTVTIVVGQPDRRALARDRRGD